MNDEIQYGFIVTWFHNRNFGFIRTENSDKELFAHASDFPDGKPIPKGTRVKFQIGMFGGRPKAIKVEVAE